MKYRVDVDETICRSCFNGVVSYPKAIPIYENIKKINILYDQGHEIIYWSARGQNSGIDWRELTEKQLSEWGAKYHELRLDKPAFDVLYDDKAKDLNDL